MEKHNKTLSIDNKGKIKNSTNDGGMNQKGQTSNLQRRLAVISKKLSLCYLVNFK
jgi:hypothetical protein